MPEDSVTKDRICCLISNTKNVLFLLHNPNNFFQYQIQNLMVTFRCYIHEFGRRLIRRRFLSSNRLSLTTQLVTRLVGLRP